jgi:hypothetical protein
MYTLTYLYTGYSQSSHLLRTDLKVRSDTVTSASSVAMIESSRTIFIYLYCSDASADSKEEYSTYRLETIY